MKVQPIYKNNSTSFNRIKFRLPINSYITGFDPARGSLTSTKCKYMYIFENPDAGMFYKQAQKTHDLKEKSKLYSQMGDFELVDLEQESLFSKMKHKFCEFLTKRFLQM